MKLTVLLIALVLIGQLHAGADTTALVKELNGLVATFDADTKAWIKKTNPKTVKVDGLTPVKAKVEWDKLKASFASTGASIEGWETAFGKVWAKADALKDKNEQKLARKELRMMRNTFNTSWRRANTETWEAWKNWFRTRQDGSKQEDCTPGMHFLKWYSLSQVSMSTGCYPNSNHCIDFDSGYTQTSWTADVAQMDSPGTAGSCNVCDWYASRVEVGKTGNYWCKLGWLFWTLFYLGIIFAVGVLAVLVLICLDAHKSNKGAYKQLNKKK